jgi:hydrogenase-4 component E
MSRIDFDIAHLLAGSLVLISFSSSIRTGSTRCSTSMRCTRWCWRCRSPGRPSSRTRRISTSPRRSRSVFKAIVIPVALHRIIVRLGIHREIETVVGVGHHARRHGPGRAVAWW